MTSVKSVRFYKIRRYFSSRVLQMDLRKFARWIQDENYELWRIYVHFVSLKYSEGNGLSLIIHAYRIT